MLCTQGRCLRVASSLRKIYPYIHVLYRRIKIEFTSPELIFPPALKFLLNLYLLMLHYDWASLNKSPGCLRIVYSNTHPWQVDSPVAVFVLHGNITHRSHDHFNIMSKEAFLNAVLTDSYNVKQTSSNCYFLCKECTELLHSSRPNWYVWKLYIDLRKLTYPTWRSGAISDAEQRPSGVGASLQCTVIHCRVRGWGEMPSWIVTSLQGFLQ